MHIENVGEYLKKNGIKPSVQRMKIFQYLLDHHTHPTVDDIFQSLSPEMPTLSKTTVYNTLNIFVSNNIIQEIIIEENEVRYDVVTEDHGHFKCKSCGEIIDFDVNLSKFDLSKLGNVEIEIGEKMKLNKELEVLLNNQINMELAASYQYQAMAAYFDERALEGFAKWMGNQAKEEIEHSRKFYDYVLKRNGKIEFFALDKPKMDFTSVKEVFEAALAHEEAVTASIENIHKLARELGDYGAEVFLNEFAEEQEEEEEQVQKLIDKIVSLDVDNNSATLYLLDKEMGTRE